MDKQELIGAMMAGRTRLGALLARVDQFQMEETALYNLWSVKDLLAHLGFWERRAVTIYQTLVSGKNPNPIAGEDGSLDEVNALAFTANHDHPIAVVRMEEEAAYADLFALAQAASQAELFDGSYFTWTKGTPFFEVIANNSYGHYEEHLPFLEEWINSRG